MTELRVSIDKATLIHPYGTHVGYVASTTPLTGFGLRIFLSTSSYHWFLPPAFSFKSSINRLILLPRPGVPSNFKSMQFLLRMRPIQFAFFQRTDSPLTSILLRTSSSFTVSVNFSLFFSRTTFQNSARISSPCPSVSIFPIRTDNTNLILTINELPGLILTK